MGVFQRGQHWYIDYYSGSERIREKVGPSKGEAFRALSVRQAEIALGKFNLVPKANVQSFALFARNYLELVSSQKRGYQNERYTIQSFREALFQAKNFRSDGRRC